jgi:hypothetical protein
MNIFEIYSDESDIIQFVRTVVSGENSDGIDNHCLLVYIRVDSAQLPGNDVQYIQ